MTSSQTPARAAGTTGELPASGHVRVAVIGAGFAGLAVAHGLRQAGIEDFVVLERGHTVGGTWRENTYPGCGCDIPSHLYSFSFAPNPSWSRSFSLQPEILRYLEGLVPRLGLERHVVTGVDVASARWEEEPARWRLATTLGDLTADVVVGATGPLTEPRLPEGVPGLGGFDGPVFHSARWRHDVDLRGKRVAVVGTGASAIQLVPALQPVVEKLVLFQRTPPWVIPKSDRRISAAERALYRRVPAAQRAVRAFQYSFREAGVPGFVFRPGLMAGGEQVALRHMHRTVKDPELRKRLTPSYRIGCKRILPSNDYYPAVVQPNVEVVGALSSVDGGRAVAADGTAHEVDAIVLGTGFDVTDLPVAHRVVGREGRTMAEVWASDGRSALRSATVAGFPNLFLMLGPNSGLGHNSMVYVIESQAAYVVDAVQEMTVRRLAAIEPEPRAQHRWNERVQRRMAGTVWQRGGCHSWYQDPDGRNTTLWPGFTFRFRNLTRGVDLGEYAQRPVDPRIAEARNADLAPAAPVAEGAR
jgi:cation diffusion facilitator CzcD-associated flavoprotein CzcO